MNHTDHNAQVEIPLYVSKAGSEAEDPDKPSHRATISQLASHHGQCHRCAAIIILISSFSCQVIMGGTTTFVNVIYPVVKERNPEIVYLAQFIFL